MDDTVVILIIALVAGVMSFMALHAAVNLVYRLVKGRFFGLINLPTALALAVYLAVWMALLWAVLSRIAITH